MLGAEVSSVLKLSTEPQGIPEWCASIELITRLMLSIRRERDVFESLLGEARVELLRLSRTALKAGDAYQNVSQALYRVSHDLDPSDIRTTSLLQEIHEIDQKYERIADNPFTRTAAADLVRAWGNVL